MKLMHSILQGLSYHILKEGPESIENLVISDVEIDSRRVKQGGVFVALAGIRSDGHAYIREAIQNGAVAILVEYLPDTVNLVEFSEVIFLQLPSTSNAIVQICQNFFDRPSERLKLIGITGTNGKTSCAFYVHSLITSIHGPCGLISTISNKVGNQEIPSTHTTPDIVSVYRLLALMVSARCEFAVMEVSSHALDQGRVKGLRFAIGMYTNLTHDHLDYHGTFQRYMEAKRILFDQWREGAVAVMNRDDKYAMPMVERCVARLVTYGMRSLADYRVRIRDMDLGSMQLEINGRSLLVPVSGGFNAMNITGVVAVANALGFDDDKVLMGVSLITGVPGRFQVVQAHSSGPKAIVDYAHTPDALKKTIQSVRDVVGHARRILCVVGCGGDRDREKRPKMAKIAAHMTDILVLTSDNPRSEKPQDIIDDMLSGVDESVPDSVYTLVDRSEAIKLAVQLAKNEDVILVAGKGHEKYQEIDGVKKDFDDAYVVHQWLSRKS